MSKHFAALLATTMLLGTAGAQAATVTFYTDRAAFDAATLTTVIDFEGIVPDAGTLVAQSHAVDGVTFESDLTSVAILGQNASFPSAPYRSAILVKNLEDTFTIGNLIVDFSTAGGGFTAAGAMFGTPVPAGGTDGTLILVGAGGVLDVRNVSVGDLGVGGTDTFFGWTVSGDSIVGILFDLAGVGTEGVDDVQFGTLRYDVPVAEPGTLALLGFGLTGLAVGRRRARR